jgi:hypothetical protein
MNVPGAKEQRRKRGRTHKIRKFDSKLLPQNFMDPNET